MNIVERIHGRYIHRRRVCVLRDHLAAVLPANAEVLDVGCGDGLVARLIREKRPDLRLVGIDVLVRRETHIPVRPFDGKVLPLGDGSVDVVMFVDVLHHTEDPMILLREGVRASRRAIVIKDHVLTGFLGGPTLRYLDRVGNCRHGVPLTYNYWPRERWLEAWNALGLTIGRWITDLRLYPWPVDLVFGRSLHFIARLEHGATGGRPGATDGL